MNLGKKTILEDLEQIYIYKALHLKIPSVFPGRHYISYRPFTSCKILFQEKEYYPDPGVIFVYIDRYIYTHTQIIYREIQIHILP